MMAAHMLWIVRNAVALTSPYASASKITTPSALVNLQQALRVPEP
jgi:hypothetical protein